MASNALSPSSPSSLSSLHPPSPSSLGSRLFSAVTRFVPGDLPAIRQLAALGAPLEYRSLSGHTALTWASEQPHMHSLVATLLSLGADVNAKVPGQAIGGTALHFAVRAGLEETCRLLLEYGADPWAPVNTLDAASPLTWAYYYAKVEVLRVFETHLAIFSGWFRCKILEKQSSGRSSVRWLVIMPSRQHQGLLESYELLAYNEIPYNEIPAAIRIDKLELTDVSVGYETKGTFNSSKVLSLRKNYSNSVVWKVQALKGYNETQLEQLRALCIAKSVPVAIQQGEQRTIRSIHSPIISHKPSLSGEVLRNSSTVSCDGVSPGTSPASGERRQEGSFSAGPSFSREEEIGEEEAMRNAIAESIEWARINGVNVSSPERTQELRSATSPSSSSQNGSNVSTPEARNATSQGRGDPPIELRVVEEMDEETQLALAMAESLEWARCFGIPTDSQSCESTELKKSQSLVEKLPSSGSFQSTNSDEKPTRVESRKEEEEREKTTECTICCMNPVNAACVPCGHMMSCHVCLQQVRKMGKGCPLCREPINRVLQVYGL